jgi:hypothetical protein
MSALNNPATMMWIAIAVMCVVPGVAAVLSTAWCKARQSEMDASLKMRMLEMGMSAEDIERVLLAQSGSGEKAGKTCCG